MLQGEPKISAKVDVVVEDGAVCQMAKQAFNVFLSLPKVVRFGRSDGWIVVGKGPLRFLLYCSSNS